MTGKTKLALSDYELQLVNNTEWILTKQQVVAKATGLLALAADRMEAHWRARGFEQRLGLPAASPKISKGENYRLLPYVMLDYPRYFDKENVFAIRSFFWWGNFFSITLQLSGRHKRFFEATLLQNLQRVKGKGYFFCINEDPWQHHFEEDNYRLLDDIAPSVPAQLIHERGFIKLAQRFPLAAWEKIPVLLEAAFEDLLQLLKA